jgi:hypothetical protein
VAGHPLIDEYLATLARRLPADTVAELADGLTETYERHRAEGLDPDPAAVAALAEFGTHEAVLAAFVRDAPGRRLARALLVTGPLVGLCWATVVLRAGAVPVPLRVGFGTALVAVVATLAYAATGRRYRSRIGAAGGLGLVALDATALALVVAAAVPYTWPLALAVAASLTRIALTTRYLPRVLARR